MNMTMQEFFSKCGSFKWHDHGGSNPSIVFFEYENGWAKYDGRIWTYSID